jgi:lysophospholipase L1-like esterase
VYVDYHSALKDERNGLPRKYSYDGVHVNPAGYKIMEEIVQDALGKTLK